MPQACLFVSGGHTQLPGLPLHSFCGAVQLPHEMLPAHPSDTVPHVCVPHAAAWVMGKQLQVPGPVDEEQKSVEPQEPQLIGGQPPFGVKVPQFSPGGQLVGHAPTHWPTWLQLFGAAQVPHEMTPPQPSGTVPQTAVPQA
jgi:hypothetical protein